MVAIYEFCFVFVFFAELCAGLEITLADVKAIKYFWSKYVNRTGPVVCLSCFRQLSTKLGISYY